VRPTSIGTINANICSNETYLFNGVNLNTAGSHLDTFINSTGCDSVVTLNLIVRPTSTGTINASICSNETYLFNGVNLNTVGSYLDTFINSAGCDSVVTLNLTVRPTSIGIINASICSNETYLFNGVNRNVTGSYIDTFTNSTGCDSLVTLNLIVRPTSTGVINASICSNETYLFNGVNRNVTGSYIDTFTNSAGCDSVVILNLIVRPTSTGIINASICSNETYLFNGVNLNTVGSYLDTFINSAGCDSVVTLNLTVRPTSIGIINASICSNETYLFNGVNRNVTGSYIDTFANSTGCDSVVTLNLLVRPTSIGVINANICVGTSYVFNGVNRTTDGSYLDTLLNYTGCDSIITLNLTIRPTSTGVINVSICAGTSYLFNGVNRTSAGSFIDTFLNSSGCDSVVSLYLNLNPIVSVTINPVICNGSSVNVGFSSYNTTGTYYDTLTSFNGCDSIIRTNLLVNPNTVFTQRITLCAGSILSVGSSVYSISGTYFDTLVSSLGCDSAIATLLNITPTMSFVNNVVLCEGTSISVGASTYSLTGIYYDTLTSFVGCDSIVRTNLTVLPKMYSSIKTTICEGASITIGMHTYTTTGRYSDTITSSLGCDSIILTILTVLSKTYFTQSVRICLGDNYQVGTSIYNDDGTYYDTLSNMDACDSVVTTIVSVFRPALITIDTTFCIGGLYDGVRYFNSSMYRDTIRATFGCDSIIVTNIIKLIPEKPLLVSNNMIICGGKTVDISAQGGFSGQYVWSPANFLNCATCANPSIIGLTNSTLFTVSSKDCNDSVISKSIMVTVKENPTVQILTKDTCVYLGQEVNLYIKNDTSFNNGIIWMDGANILCHGCPNFTFQPTHAGVYTAIYVDSFGCQGIDSFDLCVRSDCPTNSLVIPNFITPNSDGANDKFRFLNPENIPILFLRIFDRWGEKLFESYSNAPEWDATYKGKECIPGVYVYYLEGNCPASGKFFKSGNVTIVK
jgi:gliding motility-associated-like protein